MVTRKTPRAAEASSRKNDEGRRTALRDGGRTMSGDMDGFATVTAQTKRSPRVTAGKRGEPELHLPDFLCTPLDPVTAETAIRLGLEAPYTLRQTFVAGPL